MGEWVDDHMIRKTGDKEKKRKMRWRGKSTLKYPAEDYFSYFIISIDIFPVPKCGTYNIQK